MNLDTLSVGKGEIPPPGQGYRLLAFGSLVPARRCRWRRTLRYGSQHALRETDDAELILELARNHSLLVSIEENSVIGGAGSEIERVLAEHGLNVPVLRLGLPDRFIDHGEQGQLLAELGLDQQGIVRAVRARSNPQ
jgi:1-deoxy-D-xylulose-5-phosphate synthase